MLKITSLFIFFLFILLITPNIIFAQENIYGLHADLPMPLASQQGISLAEQIDIIKKTGTDMVRFRMSWDEIENIQGQYVWNQTDNILNLLNLNGLEPLVIIRDTPNWAKSNPNCGGPLTNEKICPPKLSEWKNFIQKIVERYGWQTGGLGYVRYWEIWNEPNSSLMFSGNVDEYFNLLKEAYLTIHNIDPSAKVLNGGITHKGILNADGNNWLDNLFQKQEINQFFDIFNFHLYGAVDTPENTFVKVNNLLSLYNLTSKPIWITETNPSETTEEKLAAALADWHQRIFNQSAQAVFFFTLPNWCQKETIDPVWCDQNVYTTERKIGGLVKAADFNTKTLAYYSYQYMISPSPTIFVPTVVGKIGDANNDGKVDGLDYVIWLNHYNQSATGAGNGDFNNSGKVDGLDYVIWLNNYNKQ